LRPWPRPKLESRLSKSRQVEDFRAVFRKDACQGRLISLV
jgi:hypothetical protein